MKKMTKHDRAIADRYFGATCKSVRNAYSKPNITKIGIEDAIIRAMVANHGADYRVISYNSMMFKCGYLFMMNGRVHLHYFTRSKTLVIDIHDMVCGNERIMNMFI